VRKRTLGAITLAFALIVLGVWLVRDNLKLRRQGTQGSSVHQQQSHKQSHVSRDSTGQALPSRDTEALTQADAKTGTARRILERLSSDSQCSYLGLNLPKIGPEVRCV
jgi:hypothetical protein